MEAGAECTHSDRQLVPAALGYLNSLGCWSSMGMTSSTWGCHHEGTGPGKPGMATQGTVPRCQGDPALVAFWCRGTWARQCGSSATPVVTESWPYGKGSLMQQGQGLHICEKCHPFTLSTQHAVSFPLHVVTERLGKPCPDAEPRARNV